MLSRVLLIIVFSVFCVFTNAQVKIKKYTIHKVREGETFRSVASRYHLDARELANYNNLEYYSGELAAKTLRIPKKNKKDSSADQKSSTSVKAKSSTRSNASRPENTTTAKPVIVLTDSLSQAPDPEEQPTLKSDISKNLPVILFIGGSLILLSVAIVYYRFVSRK